MMEMMVHGRKCHERCKYFFHVNLLAHHEQDSHNYNEFGFTSNIKRKCFEV